ncbi:aldehyde dehydrogenase family protein [Mycoplasmopsis fermentans]|uniref:Aldehyde dehydrogenase n=1 Tax=Mycoplasmopsis fermentans (strain M64) TaxID=943945 RepID=A0AB32XD35_MYCFM|nr:aldehyde dehydrogenase family protein [Mycoplasmopsis fermentans]ADV35005.1 Aldehyde dehydrogenase [Mycoplasmopsis fermentans M64]
MNAKNVYQLQREKILKNAFIDKKLRKENIEKLYSIIVQNESKIKEALSLDLNKSSLESYFSEIGLVLKEIKFNIKNLNKWTKPFHVSTPSHLALGKSEIQYEPLGQVLIISPWNYPFYLSLMPLVSALAAGNRVIIKPSEFSVHTSQLLQELINNNFDPQYAFVADSSLEVAQELLDYKFDLIHFTGSTTVGKIIAKKASETLTPITLELGGKCHCVVDKSQDIIYSAQKIMAGKLLNAGQTCIAPDYVLIDKNRINAFKAACYVYLENVLQNEEYIKGNYPKIINQKHFERLKKYLPKDHKINEKTLQIMPYIFETSWNDLIMQEEIFGPLLPIIPYDNLDDLLVKFKSLPKPLAAYLFTKDKKIIKLFKEQVTSGALVINDTIMHIANSNLPFGGVGDSGYGRSHGFEGFKAMSNPKAIYQRKGFNFKLNEHPYSKKKEFWIKKIIK